MSTLQRSLTLICAATALVASPGLQAASSPEQRSLTELRNTVVNLLQGLVQRGVLTREQAEAMVQDAQAKATAEADALQAQEAAEAGAVRVPYVPQIVRDEIREEVKKELTAEVANEVAEQAKAEGWGVPAALPDWIRNARWTGDVRFRAQGDLFADDNVANNYLDFQRVNQAGGIGRAGFLAFQNTTETRNRFAVRVRAGFEMGLGGGFGAAFRLSTGNLNEPVSLNAILGNTVGRYQTGWDRANLDWTGRSDSGRHQLYVTGGRTRNPWFSASNLMAYQDLAYEGVWANYRLGLGDMEVQSKALFVTLGAFPIQEVEFAPDKWMFGGQLGTDWLFDGGARLRFGAGYFHYDGITGRRNAFGSNLLDYTAPQFVQRGNTMFDIRNDNDPNTNLFALAAQYHLVNVSATLDIPVSARHRVSFTADAVRNIGYDEAKVRALTGFAVPARVNGYHGEIGFGSRNMNAAGAWNAEVAYRYTERDATLDAFNDSNLRLGGTDTQGFIVTFDYGLSRSLIARLRYLSANEIDGLPFGVDSYQVDFLANF